MVLLKGGVAVLSLGLVAQIVLTIVLDTAFDRTSILVGFSLIGLALIIFVIERLLSRDDRPDVDLEPVGSSFEPFRLSGDDPDAKWEEGRTFHIFSDFRLKSGNRPISLLRADVVGFHQGLGCLNLGTERRWQGERIPDPFTPIPPSHHPKTSDRYSVGSGSYFEPAIEIGKSEVHRLSLRRNFGPPFHGRGAPVDFRSLELSVTIEYVVSGQTKRTKFSYRAETEMRSLIRISSLSEVRYFSDRELNFYRKKGVLTQEQLELLLTVKPEIRVRSIEGSNSTAEKMNIMHGVHPDTYELLHSLYNQRETLPKFDPNAIWRTKIGRLVSFVIKKVEVGKPVDVVETVQ